MCTSGRECKPAYASCTSPRPWQLVLSPRTGCPAILAFYGVFRFHFGPAVSRYVAGGPRWLGLANSATYAGSFGVNLFFVLSAYLITELLLREKPRCSTLDVRAFYIRRMLRILAAPLFLYRARPGSSAEPGPRLQLALCRRFPPAGWKLEHSRMGMADSYHC